jgi:hypothetical protein
MKKQVKVNLFDLISREMRSSDIMMLNICQSYRCWYELENNGKESFYKLQTRDAEDSGAQILHNLFQARTYGNFRKQNKCNCIRDNA